MSGWVAVVSLDGDNAKACAAAEDLAEAYVTLRGEGPGLVHGRVAPHERGVSAASVVVVAFGGQAHQGRQAWAVTHGVAHGELRLPVGAQEMDLVDGQFSVVGYDALRDVTFAATDRFAGAPVYVAERGRMVYLGTSALAIARHLRAEPCAEALTEFLVVGSLFGAPTHWEGIRRLEPGSFVRVAGGRVSEDFYWRARVNGAVRDLRLDEAAEYVREVCVSTYRERLAGGPTAWADLTGGYDSRLMALLLDDAGVEFRANTREATLGPDIERAREIAALKGWPWREVRIPSDWPDRLPGLVHGAMVAADGRLEVLQLSRVQWSHAQLVDGGHHLLSAGGGEHFSPYPWASELPRPGRRQADIRAWVDRIGIRPSDFSLLAPGSRAVAGDIVTDSLTRWIEPYRDERSTVQLDACYAYKATGHFSAFRAADDVQLVAQLPYYFRPVFEAGFSLPQRHRDGHKLQRILIPRLDPAVAAVETTSGGPALPMRPSTVHRYLPYYTSLAKRGLNKTTAKVTGREPFPPRRDFHWDEARANANVVSHLLESGVLDWGRLRTRPLLSPIGVARFRAGRVPPVMLGRLLTAEMALHATDTGL
jgi:hypothetical protein